MNNQDIATQGTSVIVHDVAPAHRADYEAWMATALEASRRFPGYMATDVIKPVGAALRYVVILRFASRAEAEVWLQSEVRAALLNEAKPWLLQEDRYQVHDNNEFWFITPGTRGTPPKRWKQWLLSTLAVFPLTAVIPPAVGALVRQLAPSMPHVFVLALTATLISAVMVYWLMPTLSRWAAGWLGR